MITSAVAIRRSVLAHSILAGGIAVLLGVFLALAGLGILWGILLGLAIGSALSWFAHTRADVVALKAIGARRLAEGELPKLENLVSGLAVANGFRMPALYIVDDAAPNAAVVGRTSKHSGLVVTSGLLERLRRVELEGVIAHELSQVRTRQTMLGVTAGLLIGWLPEGLASLLGERMMSRRATVEADLSGVELTRYPPGLAAALTSMRADGRSLKLNPRAYRHLWINVAEGAMVTPEFSLDTRIQVLHEL